MAADEYLDLVNEQDEIIGKKLRSLVYAENLSNFRVINVFIKNRKGELWIPKRGPNKRIFPLCLDMSVGGHVESGETYEDAFKRETQEELGINVDTTQFRFLGSLTPHKHGVSAFMKVYEIIQDQAPDYNKDDFIEFFWLTPKELMQRLEIGEKSKEDLPRLVKKFYSDQLT